MKKIFAILTFWALAGMVSCSNEPEVVNPEEGVKTYELGIATDETRVEYNDGGEDGNTHKYRWEKGDELAVWYSATGAASYSAIEKPFVASIVETGKPVVFFTSATNHDQMTKGEKYDYIAMYPYPTSVNGTEVTYTIGTETAEGAYTQKKAYEADYQILRASGENLIAMTDGRPTLSEYKQMMTTLQFYVNSENSKGAYTDIQITELQIYFPEAVTGVLTIDAKTGEIKSATSDRVDVEMSSDVMSAYATRQAARQADDYVNVVCKPFTMQAYNTATPAENRIVINVIGKGKNTTSGVTETISQSIFKTVSAAKEFKAADVIAMRLDLTDKWDSYGPITMEDYEYESTTIDNYAEKHGNYAGFHCTTKADGNMVLLSNIRYFSSDVLPYWNASIFMMPLENLSTAGYDNSATLIIEFDAFGIYGNDNTTCPLYIMAPADLRAGWLSSIFNTINSKQMQQVDITPVSTNASTNVTNNWPVPTEAQWQHYSVTLQDFSAGNYVAFQLNGAFFFGGSSIQKNACWLRNITFHFKKAN
ncbi:MAG: fimbrillin family protein [Rikenellaceae bacterium]|nr:fimbrillin family protein [Rikenellaceae bacterium]